MTNLQKLLLALAFVISITLIAFVISSQQTEKEDDKFKEEREIINFSIRFGKGVDNYTYGFIEVYNGYPEAFKLVKNGKMRYAEVDDLISLKRLYLFENDTILCVDYMDRSVCSSIINESDRLGYKGFILKKFFNDERIVEEERLYSALFDGGHIIIKGVSNATVDGHPCKMVEYTIDYANVTAAEASRLGIILSPTHPKHFEWKVCADDRMVYYKYFNYTYLGKPTEFEIKITTYGSPSEIVPPEDLSKGAYDLLLEENERRSELIGCFEGEERDRCVAMIALNLMNARLCEYAGERRDRCLVSIVPFRLDEGICDKIVDQSFKDDCYIELAGGKKNSTYCARIANSSKIEFCMNVSREEQTSEIANPAATNCANKGYQYEIRTDAEGGQYGVCIYEGKECDEWALFRGECCLTNADCKEGESCADNRCVIQ
ncbi:MAG: DUF333 domain-containing protein [Candidatus Bilamarchaeaceae archaeon]